MFGLFVESVDDADPGFVEVVSDTLHSDAAKLLRTKLPKNRRYRSGVIRSGQRRVIGSSAGPRRLEDEQEARHTHGTESEA